MKTDPETEPPEFWESAWNSEILLLTPVNAKTAYICGYSAPNSGNLDLLLKTLEENILNSLELNSDLKSLAEML